MVNCLLSTGIRDHKIINSARSLLVKSIFKEETQSDFHHQRPFLPSRILALGRDKKSRGLLDRFGSNLPPHPPLTAPIHLISPDHGSTGQYLTLSHRWGKTQHFTLTKASLKSFHDSISFESLPKTFQDAVILTRKLGFQYLWIDALCIVQDDSEEWQQQAPKMASVYHNSTCTIATHSAKNDSEGFLAAALERIPSILLRHRPSYAGASRSTPEFRSLYLGSSFKDQVNKSFLNQRGWVFQERILSRRILHFTRHRVFFEDGFVVRTVDAGSSREPLTHSPWEDTKIMVEDIVATSADWYKLVERYSTCALTFDRDRLPAIAGIAAFVQTYDSGDQYLYGIWRNSLQQGLLWVVADNAPQEVYYGSTPSPPSWSWARWKGSIRFPLQSAYQPLFQHTDDSINFDNAHSNANLVKKSRFLSIRAEVLELQDVAATIINQPAGQFSFEPPMHGLYNINSKKLGIVNWMAFDGARESKLFFPYLSCVFVSLYQHTRWMYDEEVDDTVARHTRVWYFLILVKTDHTSECYRRIGIGAKYGQCPQSADLVTKTIRIE